ENRADGRRRPVERPIEPAECDQRRAKRALGENYRLAEIKTAARGLCCHKPKDQHVRGGHQQSTPQQRLLTNAGRFILELVKASAAIDKTLDNPTCDTKQTELLRSRRVNCDSISVVRVALRGFYFFSVAVFPD